MKHRLSTLIAAVVALFATPIACFASVNPVLFAAVINDPGLLQFLVGGVVSIFSDKVLRKHTKLNNGYIGAINTTLVGLGGMWLGGIPFEVAMGNGALTHVGARTLTTPAQAISGNGVKGVLKETPAQHAARIKANVK